MISGDLSESGICQRVPAIQDDRRRPSSRDKTRAFGLFLVPKALKRFPNLEVIVVTPICPHTLAVRPLIVQDHRRIDLSFRECPSAVLTADGQTSFALAEGDLFVDGSSGHDADGVAGLQVPVGDLDGGDSGLAEVMGDSTD